MPKDPDRFVGTAAIRAALKERETVILDALGISWRQAKPHITCPHLDHTDNNPSWRWDERKARARCTCGSHSILAVLEKVEGIDFEAAKLRAASILGREDLIQAPTRGKYQSYDPNSLLNPSSSKRDDRLPFIYLGSRLRTDPDAVLRPLTPFAGIKSLGYFDPPASPRSKPKLVGSHPCAIFGTVAVDGRMHAHRIYPTSDGSAKAELGIGPHGKSRDPKKSAKLADGQVTAAGCAVIWGDPKKARHLVLFEGIENGAVGAYAFRSEIEAGEIFIASGINASGVEALTPYPATELVTVGADRDEAKEGAGYRRGENAARTFALRNSDKVEVRIALPGLSGESTDWLEILLRDGVEAVRSGLLDAIRFVPNQDEIENSRRATIQTKDAEVIKNTYPLPPLETLRLEYRRIRSGEIWVHKWVGEKTETESGEKVAAWTPVSSPFGVPALLRMADADDAYGLRVFVQDMYGQPRAIDFNRAELARLGGSEIRGRLLEAGLRVEGEGESVVVQVLKAAKPSDSIIVVSRPGWHRLPEPIFVTPAGDVIGAWKGIRIELSADVKLPDRVSRRGTIEGWKGAIRAAVNAKNCPHWILGAASGFAGAIVDLIELNTCGMNISGKTSLGKTTAQQLAVSAWSSPKGSDTGLLKSMRTTENAVEALARDASGTILALDEMAHSEGKMIGRMLYSLAGDQGKARMRADSSLRRPHIWSTFALFSGEKSLEQKIREDGGQWTGGMAVRFPNIDVSEVNPCVPPETISAIDQISNHYGHAGPAFITKLVASGLHLRPDLLKERVSAMASTLAGKGADSAGIRAALPFSVLAIASSLAQEFGIFATEADVTGAIRWAWESFCESEGARALNPNRQAITNIQQFIAERWDVTVKNVSAPAGVVDRQTVAWYDQDTVYLPANRAAEAAGYVLGGQRIGAALEQGGHLSRRLNSRRIAIRYVPKIGYIDCYALRRSQFGRSDKETTRTQLHEVMGCD